MDTRQEIHDALKAAFEVFCYQMNRCDDFLSALTDDGYVPIEESNQSRSVGNERLVANYDYIEQLCIRLDELIVDGPCDNKNGSQIQNWKAAEDSFSRGLYQSDFNLNTYNEEIIEAINKEFLHLGNFRDSLSTYSCRLQDLEGELIRVFGKQTSEFAIGLDRTIYQVSSRTSVNQQRILYLSTKSPRVYTPEDVKEIKGLLDYSAKWLISINRDEIEGVGNLKNTDFYSLMSKKDSDLSKLFENYELYLCRFEQDENIKLERAKVQYCLWEIKRHLVKKESTDYEDYWNQDETYFGYLWWQDDAKLSNAIQMLQLEADKTGGIDLLELSEQMSKEMERQKELGKDSCLSNSQIQAKLYAIQALTNALRSGSYDMSRPRLHWRQICP